MKPTYAALEAQNRGLREALEEMRRVLSADQRVDVSLLVVWRHEGLRQRARADTYERQLRAAGLTPDPVDVPEPETPKHRAWTQQIEAMKTARRTA